MYTVTSNRVIATKEIQKGRQWDNDDDEGPKKTTYLADDRSSPSG